MTGWQLLVRALVHRTERKVLDVLDGLDPGLLDAAARGRGRTQSGRPARHLTRSHDRNVSDLLLGRPQRPDRGRSARRADLTSASR